MRKALIVIVALASPLVLGFMFRPLGPSKAEAPSAVLSANDSHVQAPDPEALKSRILFGGDVFWGRLFEKRQPDNYDFPFSGLDTLKRQNYHAWIADLECPVTDEVVAFDLQWEAIQFNCRPEYLTSLAKWFDVMSMANNHSDNVRGEEGLLETRQNLEKHEVQYFGNFDPAVLKDLCEVVTVKATIVMTDETSKDAELPIAMCGFHGVFKWFTAEQLAQIEPYADHFVTFVMPHAGAEYQPAGDELRREAYQTMIDHGADAVFGDHPHWIQNTEAYNGKLIAYSMGNFIFDQEFNDEVTRSALFDVTIKLPYSQDVQKLIDLAASCKTFQDDCLQQAEQENIVKPDLTLEITPVPTRTTGLVTKYSKVDEAAMLERLNWQTTSANLE